jgi:hypothetical protein
MIGVSAEKFYPDSQRASGRVFAAAACGGNQQPRIATKSRFSGLDLSADSRSVACQIQSAEICVICGYLCFFER